MYASGWTSRTSVTVSQGISAKRAASRTACGLGASYSQKNLLRSTDRLLWIQRTPGRALFTATARRAAASISASDRPDGRLRSITYLGMGFLLTRRTALAG